MVVAAAPVARAVCACARVRVCVCTCACVRVSVRVSVCVRPGGMRACAHVVCVSACVSLVPRPFRVSKHVITTYIHTWEQPT